MAQVPAQSFYLGPFAVYTSPTGMTDPITGIPYLGGTLHAGDYVDLTASEAAQWNILYGANLYPGRYRFVQLSPNAVAANLAKLGNPVGYGLGTSVAQAVVAAAGSGYTITATGASTGNVSISSSAAGGTAAVANLTLSGGAITGVQITYPGANMTSVPTFTLSSVLSGGSGGSVLAEQFVDPSFISSFDSSCAQLSTVRGVALGPNTAGVAITAAQITAGAWIVIQEEGIANVNVTAGTSISAGGYLAASTGAVVTASAAATSRPIGYFADLIDAVGASVPQLVRASLQLAVQQG